jgi:uncharacterized protein (TIGR02246 family)
MTNWKPYLLVLILALISGGSNLYSQDLKKASDSAQLLEEARQVIARVNQEWLVAIRKGDFKTVAEPYGENGIFVAPDGKSIAGAEKVEQYHRERAKAFAALTDVALVQEGITTAGKMVYEWGRCDYFVGPKDQPSSKHSGHYLTVWKKDPSGQWRIIRNLSLP